MATVAEFTLQADEFPLGTIFAELPDVTVELERVVPDPDGVIPYFWVRGTETDSIVEQFSEHPGIRDIRSVDEVGEEYLMRCTWISEYDSILDALIEPEIVLLRAIGTAEEWTFEVRGESQEAISEFQEYCQNHGVPVTLTELHALRSSDVTHELTDGQREALVLAYDRGYFNSPRDTTLAEMADELEISQQALGARVRRGNRHLLEQALIGSHS